MNLVNAVVHRLPALHRLALLAGAVLAVAMPVAHGQVVNPNLGGTTSYDGWQDMLQPFYPGYGGFPGSQAWPAPINSNVSGSGDAKLERLNGGEASRPTITAGGPYPAQESLYFGSFEQIANQLGGTLRIEDTTPVANVRTVTLQIQIGEADGYDFHSPNGAPLLKINGQATARAPMTPVLISSFQNGTFFIPETEQEEPVFVNTWGFQWDVSNLGTINTIQIDFSAVTHAQIYSMRLDQSTQTHSTSVFNGGGTTETRVIALSGDLAFGDLVVGQSATRTLTIANIGNEALNVTGIVYPSGFSGDWSNGLVVAGGHHQVNVTFSPTWAGDFTGAITVSSNATSGGNAVSVSGSGTPPVLRQNIPGTPQYNGSVTSATHRFTSTPNTSLQIEYTDNLADPNSWVLHPSTVNSGNGVFDVTFSLSGDHRATWSRGMYFRLIYQTQP